MPCVNKPAPNMKETGCDHQGVNTGSSGIGWCSLCQGISISPIYLTPQAVLHYWKDKCVVCKTLVLASGTSRISIKTKKILYWVQNKFVVQQPNPIVLLTVIDLLYICTDMTGSVSLQKQAKHKLAAVKGMHYHPNTLLYVRAFACIQISYSFPMVFSIRFNYAGFLLQLVYESEHSLENTEWCLHLCSLQFRTENCSASKAVWAHEWPSWSPSSTPGHSNWPSTLVTGFKRTMLKSPSKCFLNPKRHPENSDACSLVLGGDFEWCSEEEQCKWREIQE